MTNTPKLIDYIFSSYYHYYVLDYVDCVVITMVMIVMILWNQMEHKLLVSADKLVEEQSVCHLYLVMPGKSLMKIVRMGK